MNRYFSKEMCSNYTFWVFWQHKFALVCTLASGYWSTLTYAYFLTDICFMKRVNLYLNQQEIDDLFLVNQLQSQRKIQEHLLEFQIVEIGELSLIGLKLVKSILPCKHKNRRRRNKAKKIVKNMWLDLIAAYFIFSLLKGKVAEWLKAADSKSVDLYLRRFESYLSQKYVLNFVKSFDLQFKHSLSFH